MPAPSAPPESPNESSIVSNMNTFESGNQMNVYSTDGPNFQHNHVGLSNFNNPTPTNPPTNRFITPTIAISPDLRDYEKGITYSNYFENVPLNEEVAKNDDTNRNKQVTSPKNARNEIEIQNKLNETKSENNAQHKYPLNTNNKNLHKIHR